MKSLKTRSVTLRPFKVQFILIVVVAIMTLAQVIDLDLDKDFRLNLIKVVVEVLSLS